MEGQSYAILSGNTVKTDDKGMATFTNLQVVGSSSKYVHLYFYTQGTCQRRRDKVATIVHGQPSWSRRARHDARTPHRGASVASQAESTRPTGTLHRASLCAGPWCAGRACGWVDQLGHAREPRRRGSACQDLSCAADHLEQGGLRQRHGGDSPGLCHGGGSDAQREGRRGWQRPHQVRHQAARGSVKDSPLKEWKSNEPLALGSETRKRGGSLNQWFRCSFTAFTSYSATTRCGKANQVGLAAAATCVTSKQCIDDNAMWPAPFRPRRVRPRRHRQPQPRAPAALPQGEYRHHVPLPAAPCMYYANAVLQGDSSNTYRYCNDARGSAVD